MCGIAGIIHRGKSTNVGGEMQKMLQSLKHRGPDSTGYALYGSGKNKDYILRFKVGENVGEGSSAIMEDASIYDIRKIEVNKKIEEAGGKIIKEKESNFDKGTSIKVKNIFFNVPARRNFLKSDFVELRHIMNVFHNGQNCK